MRELRNVLQRALVFHQPTLLTSEHIELERYDSNTDFYAHEGATAALNQSTWGQPGPLSGGFVLPQAGLNLENLERSLLVQALQRSQNNQTKAATLLGISRHTLRYRLEKHGLLDASSTGDHVVS